MPHFATDFNISYVKLFVLSTWNRQINVHVCDIFSNTVLEVKICEKYKISGILLFS